MPAKIPTFRPRSFGQPVDRHREYNRFRRDDVLLKLYSTGRWKTFRRMIRLERILCERCRAEGRTVEGVEVHHIVSPRVDMGLAFEPTNVTLLCTPCHSRITASNKGK